MSLIANNRSISLDILRGATVALMIVVNNQYIGDTFPQLLHSTWNGVTFADLIFPFFLFNVGASLFFVAQKHNFELNKELTKKIILRSINIFCIGIFLNWYSTFCNLSDLRILGVMQRIALVYLCSSFLLLRLKNRQRIIPFIMVLLLIYWVLIMVGGDYTLEGNLVRKIDLLLLGESHLYSGYGLPFDPEGILSTLPAIASTMLGYSSALLMNRSDLDLSLRVKKLFWAGLGCVATGLYFGEFFPINKPLWSSSYVLHIAGFAMISWSLISAIVDFGEKRRFTTPFLLFGSNALTAYIAAALIHPIFYSIKIHGNSLSEWFALYLDIPNGALWLFGLFFIPLVLSIFYIIIKKAQKRFYTAIILAFTAFAIYIWVNINNLDYSLTESITLFIGDKSFERCVTLLWGVIYTSIIYLLLYPLYKRKIFIKL